MGHVVYMQNRIRMNAARPGHDAWAADRFVFPAGVSPAVYFYGFFQKIVAALRETARFFPARHPRVFSFDNARLWHTVRFFKGTGLVIYGSQDLPGERVLVAGREQYAKAMFFDLAMLFPLT
jgi:hypothetical protein